MLPYLGGLGPCRRLVTLQGGVVTAAKWGIINAVGIGTCIILAKLIRVECLKRLEICIC
jgi:hypothetical protein